MKKTRLASVLLALLLILALPFSQANAASSKDVTDSSQSLIDLLKEVYANEQNLDSYKFDGNINLGLILPETEEVEPEVAVVFEMLKDIQIDISGAYKKDPMQLEATIDLTLKGDIETKLSIPLVMTQEKMWIKLPQSPLLPLPEELKGKFIEFDLSELAELSGEPATALDYELQTKMNSDIMNLFVELLGKDFYKEVDPSTVEIPEGIEADKVIKFELTNETIKPFIEILFNDMLPKFVELLEKPEYVEALGLTAEDVKLLKESLSSEEINVDEVVAEFNKFLKINKLEEIIVITEDNYISYDEGTIDFTILVEEKEAFTLKLSSVQTKSNVNEKFDFTIGIPSGENVLPFEKLLEMEEAALTNSGIK